MLQPGDTAPDFMLPDQDGNPRLAVGLPRADGRGLFLPKANARGKPIVLSTLMTSSVVPVRTKSVSNDVAPAACRSATNASSAEAFAASADAQLRPSPVALAVVTSPGTNRWITRTARSCSLACAR